MKPKVVVPLTNDFIAPAASVAQLLAPSDWRPGGRGFNPPEVGNILS